LTLFQRVGLPLEVALHMCNVTLGVQDYPNDFTNYADECSDGNGRPVDNETESCLFECKNLNGTYRLRYSWLDDEVVSRFDNTLGNYGKTRMLVLSIDNLSQPKRNYLLDRGIQVVSVGFQVTWRNIKRVVTILTTKLANIKTNNKHNNTQPTKHKSDNILTQLLSLRNTVKHTKPVELEYVTMNRQHKVVLSWDDT